jgi:putative DNA primase/helicase
MDNYQDVIHQMQQAGCVFKDKDLPLQIPTVKRRTCGEKGKWWYWLQLWRPRDRDGKETGSCLITGRFGSYSTRFNCPSQKVEIDFQPMSDAEKARMRAEREAAAAAARVAKEESAQLAALSAGELWGHAVKDGSSPYLQRKGVQGESCRYLARWVSMQRHDHDKDPIKLPPGTLVLPLLRYDRPRAEALRGLQLIKPDGFKIFTEGFSKTGCALRLGEVDASTSVVLVCEGYATGLSIRMATGRRWPVYVALDAYNLAFVVDILREIHPRQHLLICADDDWKSVDHDGPNPGRNKAMAAAKPTPRCDIIWPVFDPDLRQVKDTDFNDLHQRQGLEAVARQFLTVLALIEKGM